MGSTSPCSAADGSPDSIFERTWVTSDMGRQCEESEEVLTYMVATCVCPHSGAPHPAKYADALPAILRNRPENPQTNGDELGVEGPLLLASQAMRRSARSPTSDPTLHRCCRQMADGLGSETAVVPVFMLYAVSCVQLSPGRLAHRQTAQYINAGVG
jgi:hypothetical protein